MFFIDEIQDEQNNETCIAYFNGSISHGCFGTTAHVDPGNLS